MLKLNWIPKIHNAFGKLHFTCLKINVTILKYFNTIYKKNCYMIKSEQNENHYFSKCNKLSSTCIVKAF